MKNYEEFKDVKGYEGIYQVSNYGRVKSLAVSDKSEDRILKTWLAGKGYPQVRLYKEGEGTNMYVHTLVAVAFKGHEVDSGLVIDHLDGNKLNNFAWNLESITNRENLIRHRKDRDTKSSIYSGVTKVSKQKWVSKIYINGVNKHLGTFDVELEAANAYQEALQTI